MLAKLTYDTKELQVLYSMTANVKLWVDGQNTFHQASGIFISMFLFRENSKPASRVDFLSSRLVLTLQIAQELVPSENGQKVDG